MLKYTFKEKSLIIDNGEPVEVENEVEYRFSLNMNGLKLFEQEYGKPLIKSLTRFVQLIRASGVDDDSADEDKALIFQEILDEKLVRSLASASYFKVVNNQAVNNEVTVDEFKATQTYYTLVNDMEFVMQLMNMATTACFDPKKNNQQSSGVRKN